MRLNSRSLQLINNIREGFISHPMFSEYEIDSYFDENQSGSFFMDITHKGQFMSKYMFWPTPYGDIHSIAIYGISLREHLRKISSSMKCFGLEVEDVRIDDEGLNPYVDVTLKPY